MVEHNYGGWIGLGKEDGFGTAVDSTEWSRFISANIEPEREVLFLDNSGARYENSAVFGSYLCRPSASLEVRPDNLGLLLLGLFGASAPSQQGGTTAWKHTFTRADTPQYLSWEQRFGSYSTKSRRAISASINGMTLSWRRDILTALVNAVAQKDEEITPTEAELTALNPFIFHQATITLAGSTAPVRSGSITISNSVITDDMNSGSMFPASLEHGKFVCTTDFELSFSDLSNLKRFWGSATTTSPGATLPTYADAIKFTGPIIEDPYHYEIEFTIPKNVWEVVSINTKGKELITQRIRGHAYYDGTSKVVDCKLTNTKSSY